MIASVATNSAVRARRGRAAAPSTASMIPLSPMCATNSVLEGNAVNVGSTARRNSSPGRENDAASYSGNPPDRMPWRESCRVGSNCTAASSTPPAPAASQASTPRAAPAARPRQAAALPAPPTVTA